MDFFWHFRGIEEGIYESQKLEYEKQRLRFFSTFGAFNIEFLYSFMRH